jgi:hypothetical protein
LRSGSEDGFTHEPSQHVKAHLVHFNMFEILYVTMTRDLCVPCYLTSQMDETSGLADVVWSRAA